MTTASVPSTLVKCLYLFFDLPEMSDSEADETDVNSEFTPRERRILLQKIFVQVRRIVEGGFFTRDKFRFKPFTLQIVQ